MSITEENMSITEDNMSITEDNSQKFRKYGFRACIFFLLVVVATFLMSFRNNAEFVQKFSEKQTIECLNISGSSSSKDELDLKNEQMVNHIWENIPSKAIIYSKWQKMLIKNPCIIWYIGSSNEALRLKTEYKCEMHIFEPVYSSYLKLKDEFNDSPLSHIYNYGIGENIRNAEHNGVKDDIFPTFYIILRKLDIVYKELSNGGMVDLFHIDCEGCELGIIEALMDYDLLRYFKTIQFGSYHYYVGDTSKSIIVNQQYHCKIISKLATLSRKVIYDHQYGLQRWETIFEECEGYIPGNIPFYTYKSEKCYKGKYDLCESDVVVSVMTSNATKGRYKDGPFPLWSTLSNGIVIDWYSPSDYGDEYPFYSLNILERGDNQISDYSMTVLETVVRRHPTKKWFLKLDDDAFLYVPNLMHVLADLDPSQFVFAGREICPLVDSECLFSGGAGYIFSNMALTQTSREIRNYYNEINNENAEDVLVASYVKHHLFKEIAGLWINIPTMYPFKYSQVILDSYSVTPDVTEEFIATFPITFHWIRTLEESKVYFQNIIFVNNRQEATSKKNILHAKKCSLFFNK